MRKVNLTNYTKRNSKYLICFSDNLHYSFNSEKRAVAFLKKSSKFLTHQIMNLNLIYTDIHSIYRKNYFFIDSKLVSNQIKRSMFEAEKSMELALGRSNWSNGNIFTLVHIECIYESLESACNDLLVISSSNSTTPLKYEIYTRLNQLNILKDDYHKFQFEQKSRIDYQEQLKVVYS